MIGDIAVLVAFIVLVAIATGALELLIVGGVMGAVVGVAVALAWLHERLQDGP